MITLSYFHARGRGQFIRAFLLVRGIDFVDERIRLDNFENWYAIRDDRSRTGPLKKLPVLEHKGRLIPETLVIAAYLHRELGDRELFDDELNLRHDVLASTCYVDLMMPLGTLIWASLLFGAPDITTPAKNTLERFKRTLAALDTTLTEWRWADTMAERPVTVADCLLWEELDQAATVFGPHLSFAEFPALANFRDRHPARETFQTLLAENPCQLTGRPGEAEEIARIRAAIAAED